MKIDILCNDGSPLGVTEATIYGTPNRVGVGGAELGLLTMCRAWQFYGNDVTLYNNPDDPLASTFKQRAIDDFDPHAERDILIIFRSPNPRSIQAKGKKIWWSCDQHTIGGFQELAREVSKIVTISPRHAQYFKETYGIKDTVTIDIPVRTWEYNKDIKKQPHSCIFTSIPDRGLNELHAIWPLILREVPDATLTITSDWRLWADWQTEEAVLPYRLRWAHHKNITYRAAVSRNELIDIQLGADLHLYSGIYDELFCIAVAESQVAGVVPITSDAGALRTTNMGCVIHGSPTDPAWVDTFVKHTVEYLTDEKLLRDKQNYLREVAKKRFSVEKILGKWEDEVFNG